MRLGYFELWIFEHEPPPVLGVTFRSQFEELLVYVSDFYAATFVPNVTLGHV
jgi:hypothetical protein